MDQRRFGSARIASNSAMVASSSASSVRSLSTSRAVRRRNGMSRMALAWISLSSKLSMRLERASAVSAEARMILITSSMLSTAMIRPSRMWARALA